MSDRATTSSPLDLRAGFLAFPRGLLEWPVYRSLRVPGRQVVLTLLLRARYAPGEFWFAGDRIPLAVGELIDSEETLARFAGVSRKVVRTSIERLEKGGFLARRRAHPSGQCPFVISIKDYALLLPSKPEEGPPKEPPTGTCGANDGPTTGLRGAPCNKGSDQGEDPGEPRNPLPRAKNSARGGSALVIPVSPADAMEEGAHGF